LTSYATTFTGELSAGNTSSTLSFLALDRFSLSVSSLFLADSPSALDI